MAHSTRATLALAHLAERDPALGVLALWCHHRDDPGVMRTRGDVILYPPEFDGHPLHEQVGLVGHHVLHVALRHSARAGQMAERLGQEFDVALFGLVADSLVNETLLVAGHGLPRPAVTVTGLLAAAGWPAESTLCALAEWDTESLYMALAGPDTAEHRAQEYAQQQDFTPDLEPIPASEDEGDGPADWQGHLSRALEAGLKAGRGIGAKAGGIADLQPPRTRWEQELRHLLARALQEQPRLSYKRPSGRWAAAEAEARSHGNPVPVFEPGRQRTRLRPSIAIGLDTSGSVTPLILRLFASEVAGIVRRTGAACTVLAFDETVHWQEDLRAGECQARLSSAPMRRGGGTAYADLMTRINLLKPSVAVILTDLDGIFGTPPEMPVLWAVPKAPAFSPPFGRVLVLA
ncbi:hypothetical protein P775_21760 [Puniceibacterium antarcticum]|uniref:Metallopeptidase domain-containing protein n=1 Tax=Puniceibacterium antarcticum TaxID=1206336 RepID=A0A2G8R9C6_9RHOB|nr:VWA-like domain-containing protein [Puniceibacterium antarcticum]PIL18051.1 hypothetical protein P775_21760 [Puniceibacterium antarcticum]